MVWQALFGEKATTKLAGFFDTQDALEAVSQEVRQAGGLQNTQLWVVRPHAADFERRLEPETEGVARTAVRAHLRLGALGVIAGVLLWAVLYFLGVPAVTASPYYSAGAIVFFAAVGGLLLGGLITARPDHQIVIQAVETATRAGRWSLVMHPRDREQCRAVEAVLAEAGVETVRSV